MVALFFVPDYLTESPSDLPVFDAAPEQRFQILFVQAEQAGAYFSVGGEANPVAMTAERLADGRDDADLPSALREAPALRRFRTVRRMDRLQIKASLQTLEDFASRHDEFLLPRPARIERHEFDETKAQFLDAGEFGERLDFMIVDAANDHGVHLHRIQADLPRQFEAHEHFAQAVASGDFLEVTLIERI